MQINQGRLCNTKFVESEFCDERPENTAVELLVIHNISLPPGEFGGSHVEELFTGNLDPQAHPYFQDISGLRVSAHAFINREGGVAQFVSFDKRAWHAGFSVFQGRDRCNDFSIGIEMEGTDNLPYTDAQYASLTVLTKAICIAYPHITLGKIVGHNDIAFGRKTDPGPAFDWCRYRQGISTLIKEG